MRVTFLILLSSIIAAEAQNCSKPLGGANMNLRGDAILNNEFAEDSSVSFSCNTGYTSAGGSRNIKCTAGKWSPVRLVCERKNCGAFPEVENGHAEYPEGNTEYGDTAVITCNRGYYLVGRNKIPCDDQGWNGRPGVCEVVTCTPPGAIVNGTFSQQRESYSYGDVVTYSCRSDTALSGSAQITCSEDGKFIPGPPTCVWVDCKDPGIANADFVEGSRPPYRHLASVTYRCSLGYKMFGSSTLKCNISSQWTPEIPTCKPENCSKPVGGSNMDLKGDAILSNVFEHGSSVSFSCNVGYTSAGGSQTIKCTAGKWSSVELVCKRKNCGPLPDVEHGHAEYPEGTEYGDTAVITCNQGYYLVGRNKIPCDDQGWNGRPGVCEVVTCTPPGAIVNGTFSQQRESYSYGDVVTYSCRSDTALNGSAQITCSEDGKFIPGPPTCVWVDCKDPGIANADFVEGSRRPYRHLASVTYRCSLGYKMFGSSTLKCNISSQWTPGIPACKPENCSKPVGGSNMDLKGDAILSNVFEHGSSVSFSCNVGYTSAGGSQTIKCTAGKWSSVELVCKNVESHSNTLKNVGIGAGVSLFAGVVGFVASYKSGFPAFIWGKKSAAEKGDADKDDADKDPTKCDNGETVPLSVQSHPPA